MVCDHVEPGVYIGPLGDRLTEQLDTALGREHSGSRRISDYGDHDPVGEAGGSPDHIDMSIGWGVEAPWAQCGDHLHRLLLVSVDSRIPVASVGEDLPPGRVSRRIV